MTVTRKPNQSRNVGAHILAMGREFNSDIEALTHVTKHMTSVPRVNKPWLDGEDNTLQRYLADKGVLQFIIPGVTDSTDWPTEPCETIEQLCDRLCDCIEQIYDEIILGYSGGTDSETIAQYFLRRGTRNLTLLHRPLDLWPGHNIGQHVLNGQLQWADQLTADALKVKYAWAIKNLGWKVKWVKHVPPYDAQQYEKSMMEREFLCWENDYNNINSWAQNSGQPMFKAKGKRSCFIEGLEKPEIVLDKGWFKFHVTHDSQWWGSTAVPLECDKVWFWLNNLVPEVIKKLSHLKAKEMTKIFQERGLVPTANEVEELNYDTRYRTRILKAMNMWHGLTPYHLTNHHTVIETTAFHYGPLELIPDEGSGLDHRRGIHCTSTSGISGTQRNNFVERSKLDWKISERSQKKQKMTMHKSLIKDQFYDQVIVKDIHKRFLNKTNRTMYGISTKLFPIMPAPMESKDNEKVKNIILGDRGTKSH